MLALEPRCTAKNVAAIRPATWEHGFTAVELMVVVAIVAILAALAGPSFAPLIERWRVRDAAEAPVSYTHLTLPTTPYV